MNRTLSLSPSSLSSHNYLGFFAGAGSCPLPPSHHSLERHDSDDGGDGDDDEGDEWDDGHDDEILQHVDQRLVVEVVARRWHRDDHLSGA